MTLVVPGLEEGPMEGEKDAKQNTDRELWRERPGDFYSDRVFVTEGGGIGMDCGGYVVVKPVREWHRVAALEISGADARAIQDEIQNGTPNTPQRIETIRRADETYRRSISGPPRSVNWSEDADHARRQAYVMAMAILQSELYRNADDELRWAVDDVLASSGAARGVRSTPSDATWPHYTEYHWGECTVQLEPYGKRYTFLSRAKAEAFVASWQRGGKAVSAARYRRNRVTG